jgi:L-aminopeptidase/D-esterase-like protein
MTGLTNAPVNTTITGVPGIEAGHYTDLANATGCTVLLCREGAVGGVDVRGGSPGTRETDLLRPSRRVDRVFAVVLSGGSAFGLDAASGVMAYLEEQGIGFRVNADVTVPIVSSAILYDLGVITSKVRPGAQDGRAACLAASGAPMEEGSVGAGAGATVAKTGGPHRSVKGGIGSASIRLPGGPVVAAAVAVNAIGGIWDYSQGKLVAGPRREDGGFDDPLEALFETAPVSPRAPENTSIGLVATDVSLSREEANYLARVSHDGLAMTIRPCHTIRDGDTMFAMATGRWSGAADLTALGAAAAEVTARAVLRAVRLATGLGGIPSVSELTHASD